MVVEAVVSMEGEVVRPNLVVVGARCTGLRAGVGAVHSCPTGWVAVEEGSRVDLPEGRKVEAGPSCFVDSLLDLVVSVAATAPVLLPAAGILGTVAGWVVGRQVGARCTGCRILRDLAGRCCGCLLGSMVVAVGSVGVSVVAGCCGCRLLGSMEPVRVAAAVAVAAARRVVVRVRSCPSTISVCRQVVPTCWEALHHQGRRAGGRGERNQVLLWLSWKGREGCAVWRHQEPCRREPGSCCSWYQP